MKLLLIILFLSGIIFPSSVYPISEEILEKFPMDLNDPIKYLEEEIQKNPNNYKLKFILGTLYFELGVLKYDKDTKEITHNLEMLKKAKNEFEEVLKIKNDESLAYYYLGHLAMQMGFGLKEAEKFYKKAIETNNHNLRAYKKLTIIYLTEKRFKDAVSLLETAKTVSRDDADIYYKLAFTYLITEEYKKAIENAKKVLSIGKSIQSQIILASAYSMTGDYDAAKAQLEDVLNSDPKNKTALVGLSIVFEKMGEKEKCIEILKKALEYYPDDSEIKIELDKCK